MTREYNLEAGRVLMAKKNGDVYSIRDVVRIPKPAISTLSVVNVCLGRERDWQRVRQIIDQRAAQVRVPHWGWILRFRNGGLFVRRYQMSLA